MLVVIVTRVGVSVLVGRLLRSLTSFLTHINNFHYSSLSGYLIDMLIGVVVGVGIVV